MNPYIGAIGAVMVLGAGVHLGGFMRTGEYGLLSLGGLFLAAGVVIIWLARVIGPDEDDRW